jgi:leucyl-tRNA synthetase
MISLMKKNVYDPAKIEPKWQKKWAAKKLYKSKEDPKKDKFYVLDMFPYPSGEGLHVGHPKGYIATDVVSRFQRMNGRSVLHPMGFDAFGLPAENYALKTKTNPEIAVKKNVERYKKQLEILGFDYDWSREVNTTDPKYYKWTQWIFLQLLKKGLAYESYEPVNWCPTDKTVLANEDVENGRCERCGTPVEKKLMKQWVLKITDYADRLLKDLDAKDGNAKPLLDWPASIKELQRNWIGRSEGAEIDFRLTFAKNKTRFMILHGFEGGAKTDFHPWLKDVLEKHGQQVEVPELPNSYHPKEAEQVEYVLTNCKLDENTVIVAHSLGAVVAMKALMKLNKPISGLVIVASAVDPKFDKFYESRSFNKDFNWDYDYAAIKRLTSGKIAVLSDSREPKRAPYLKYLADKLSARLVETTSKEEHFCAIEEPEVLKAVTPSVKVFTTRPDTLFGVTYMVLAPEHPWVQVAMPHVENKAEVEAYIFKSSRETEIERTDATKEKTGVELKGVKAVNPANNEEVPVWIADYVLADYGTGAVMAVPAHDERDWAFAKKFGLLTRDVIAPTFGEPNPADEPVDGSAIMIFDRQKSLYACLHWHNPERYTIVTGAKKGSESYEETARRELKEEAGISDVKSWHRLGGKLFAHYYNQSKKEFKSASSMQFLAVIDSHDIGEHSREPHETFDLEWKTAAEMLDLFEKTIPKSRHIFEILGRAVLLLCGLGIDKTTDISKFDFVKDVPFLEPGILIDSGRFSGKASGTVMKEITESVGGKWVTKFKLRDWVFSRQRYWGEPIPVIQCENCGVVPVPEKDLPVELPKVKSYEPTGTGESPLVAVSNWVNVKCPKCRGPAKRETNTMPSWAGSSWYYLRYEDPKNTKAMVGPKNEKYWSPIDLYVGGAEHATRHLIYARFWHKFLYDIGVVSTIEPFIKLQHVGLIMGEDGRKMSKRFGNVVNPDEIVKTFGADTLRIYEMFMGPFDQQIAWSTESIVGARRFIEKVWRIAVSAPFWLRTFPLRASQSGKVPLPSGLEQNSRIIHKTIKKVTDDIMSLRFNTAISSLMIAVNELEKATISREDFEVILKLLAPFAPHVSEELWASLGHKESIHVSGWPVYDPKLSADDEATIIVQINGKVRGSFKSKIGSDKGELERIAKGLPETKKWLEGKKIGRVIVVPDRLVNIVLTD